MKPYVTLGSIITTSTYLLLLLTTTYYYYYYYYLLLVLLSPGAYFTWCNGLVGLFWSPQKAMRSELVLGSTPSSSSQNVKDGLCGTSDEVYAILR